METLAENYQPVAQDEEKPLCPYDAARLPIVVDGADQGGAAGHDTCLPYREHTWQGCKRLPPNWSFSSRCACTAEKRGRQFVLRDTRKPEGARREWVFDGDLTPIESRRDGEEPEQIASRVKTPLTLIDRTAVRPAAYRKMLHFAYWMRTSQEGWAIGFSPSGLQRDQDAIREMIEEAKAA